MNAINTSKMTDEEVLMEVLSSDQTEVVMSVTYRMDDGGKNVWHEDTQHLTRAQLLKGLDSEFFGVFIKQFNEKNGYSFFKKRNAKSRIWFFVDGPFVWERKLITNAAQFFEEIKAYAEANNINPGLDG